MTLSLCVHVKKLLVAITKYSIRNFNAVHQKMPPVFPQTMYLLLDLQNGILISYGLDIVHVTI